MGRMGLSLLLMLLMLLPRICTCSAAESDPTPVRTSTTTQQTQDAHTSCQPEQPTAPPCKPMSKHGPHEHDDDCLLESIPLGISQKTALETADEQPVTTAPIQPVVETASVRSVAILPKPILLRPPIPRYLAFLTLVI